jgi:tRNA (guanine37-N1)-methyltransferase
LKIDIVTIFPEFFDVLGVSLIGKASQKGMLDFGVHNLRDYTHDNHKTVDDTPYGGGAGMVMRPEPWGEALDQILTKDSLLIFPSPAGEVFSQPLAREFAAEKHLVFACGRYEGIDQRVIDHYASISRVIEVSLGDYVLNGGEVAAMAIIEATSRLIPGMVGNPDSLSEESHENGLLEYPAYTKPGEWRGLSVPEVLLSGNHAMIAEWRKKQQLDRTKKRRPDLLD